MLLRPLLNLPTRDLYALARDEVENLSSWVEVMRATPPPKTRSDALGKGLLSSVFAGVPVPGSRDQSQGKGPSVARPGPFGGAPRTHCPRHGQPRKRATTKGA